MGLIRVQQEVQVSVYEVVGMIQIWPNQKRGRKNIFPSFLILREIGNKKNQGLKNEDWEHRIGTWLPRAFLEKNKKFSFPKVTFFLFTNVIFFLIEKYHLNNLGSFFYPLLTIHLIWDAYDTRSRKHLDQEGLRKISALSATIVCRVELGGIHSLWS